ncbi:hypothetical protein SNE40_005373 [Patella caerulea]|uniref:Ubiquitin carboxyl-terminal hydrolase 47 n=1 Tax=Patella caerulea TaxID=87958 RepID=A0AAN8K1K0_PATCE
MVTDYNTQLVSTENGSTADELKVTCIIRNMVNSQSSTRHTVTLPISMGITEATSEISKICGFERHTVSIRYEYKNGEKMEEVFLDDMPDQPLSMVCNSDCKRQDFYVFEKDGIEPKKLETSSSSSDMSMGEASGYKTMSNSSIPSSSTTFSDTSSVGIGSSASDFSCSYSQALLKSDTGFIGLVNQAMTCYLNSLLQTLYMTPEFRNALYRWEYDGTEEDAVKNIPYHLQRLFLQLQTSKKRSVETTDLTKSFGWDSSEVWQQHDVQELCRVMFDALEQKWKNTKQANLINQLYQGKLKDYVKCLECGYESARTDAYLDIPLVVQPFGSNKAYGSVEEAMNAFVQPETLEDSNQYFCERCNKKCNAHKGLKFITFPYLLTMQLKRFDFDYSTMHRIKLNNRMTFPDLLDINSFIEDSDIKNREIEEENGEELDRKKDEVSSNGPVDSSDEGIDEGIEVENSLSGTSSSSDSSSVGSEAAVSDKNTTDTHKKGPYQYDLFSVMIHSGSAAGGHYYAYIKSFEDGQWYSFNDQQVSRITFDDIRKVYGGSSVTRGFYSSAYASSTNAYMLMYRQRDKKRNSAFLSPEEFPSVLKDELKRQQVKEEAERRQREIDKSTCKIKLYCMHPVQLRKMDVRFEIHKDKTLREATKQAYTLFDLDTVLPLDQCRLIKYDEHSDSLEKSYEGEEDTDMGSLLGGVKSSYTFDLLLETRTADSPFQEYKPGGVTVKVYNVDIEREIIHAPVSIRAYHVQTIQEFKHLVAQKLQVNVDNIRLVFERFHNDLRLLTVPNKTLKAEGFFKSNKVYVECSDNKDENAECFLRSKFYQLLDRHQNTIRIYVSLPTEDEVHEYLKNLRENHLRHQQILRTLSESDDMSPDDITQTTSEPIMEFENNYLRTLSIHGSHSDPSVYHSCRDNTDLSPAGSDARSTSPVGAGSSSQDMSSSADCSLSLNSNQGSQSLSPDAPSDKCDDLDTCDMDKSDDNGDNCDLGSQDDGVQRSSDKDSRTYKSCSPETVVEHAETENYHSSASYISSGSMVTQETPVSKDNENWDLDTIPTSYTSSSASQSETSFQDEPLEEVKYYFYASFDEYQPDKWRSVTVFVDKRISLGAFKKEMEPFVGTISENFKVYRVYSNNQEFESIRLSDTLTFLEDGRLNIKLGRALQPDEHRVKVYQLLVNQSEPCKFLIETIFAKGMTVLESKKIILPEVKEKIGLDIPLNRCRLRKKTWKNPGNVYQDSLIYDKDISIFPNWEVFLEVLDAPDEKTSSSQLALYVRRWRPSLYQFECFQEVVLNHETVDELKSKISDISGIPLENVDIAKGKGTFPCEMSVLEAQLELDWSPQAVRLNVGPLYICDDGHVVYYRDKTEELAELSEERKKEIQQKENIRIAKYSPKMSTYSPRKERALKIYTDDDPPSSSKLSPDLD